MKRHLRPLPYKLWVQVNGCGRRYSCLVPELVRMAVCLWKLTQDILGFPLYWVSPNKHRKVMTDICLADIPNSPSQKKKKEKQQSSPLQCQLILLLEDVRAEQLISTRCTQSLREQNRNGTDVLTLPDIHREWASLGKNVSGILHSPSCS